MCTRSLALVHGPAFTPGEPELAPVPAVTSNFGGDTAPSRTQLPASLRWAPTTSKAQGQTHERIAAGLGSKEIGLGLTYVAFSRVTRLPGLLFRGNDSF